jgi:hypothetical protein
VFWVVTLYSFVGRYPEEHVAFIFKAEFQKWAWLHREVKRSMVLRPMGGGKDKESSPSQWKKWKKKREEG